MIERDAFELRLHAAVRDYAGRISSELDPVELAHRIAAAEPRRRGLTGALRWPTPAVPRRAVVLFLLAVVLAAMAAGMLVVGSQPAPKFPTVLPPVGATFVCPPESTPDEPGPVEQARPVSPRLAAFDRRAGKLVVLTAAGDGPGRTVGIETWAFDVCTNTWTQMHPSREPSSIEWRPLVYDINSDLSILVSSGKVWAYDLQTDTWSEKGVAPANATLWAYDPRSGLVVAARYDVPSDLWDYDVENDTWTPIRQPIGPSDSNPPYVVYDVSVDRIIAPGAEAPLFDLRAGTWSRSGAQMPTIIAGYGMQAPNIVFDEAAGRTIVFGNGRMIAYDATADRWEILLQGSPVVYADGLDLGPDRHSFQDGKPVAYDPVNRRLIGWDSGDADQEGLAGYDLVNHQLTVLVEPGEGQAAPSP
jgi:hypothetical protein